MGRTSHAEWCEPPRTAPRHAIGNSVVATVHPLASQAAQTMLRSGGNAIDAVVAAALTLSVVDGHNSGIGGGCFILVHTAQGEQFAIDGREMAPLAAHRDMYLRDGKPQTDLSQTGPLAIAIPGQVKALAELHKKWGKLPWEQLFEPAIMHAQQGYRIAKATAQAIRNEAKELARFTPSAQIFLNAGQQPREVGQVMVQTDLAETLRCLAKQGSDWFYHGDFASLTAKYLQDNGGVLTVEDMKAYHTVWRDPLKSRYRNYAIIGFPPPSSGGLHVAQMLNMLERFPLTKLKQEQPHLFYHVLAEAMKLAFADRAHWLGDPDQVAVPRRLIDREYTDSLSRQIRMDQAIDVAGHGQPPNATSDVFELKKHTTHLTAADAQGNWVAMTATVNTTWGSKVTIPGTGVIMNNQMDDFSIAPGTPNAFGLVGAEANAIAPRKRPLSSMSPTIVLNEQSLPVLSCGAAGGPRIINAVLQTLVQCLDLGQNIDQALAAPRLHHQWRPNELLYEPEIEASDVESLAAMGHTMKKRNGLAVAQGIQRTQSGLLAASDPRVEGEAIGID